MPALLAEQVRSYLLELVADPLATLGLTPAEVLDDFDLLATGMIDSLGLLDLITSVEERFDVVIDFEELPPEQLTVVGPFCRYVAGTAAGT